MQMSSWTHSEGSPLSAQLTMTAWISSSKHCEQSSLRTGVDAGPPCLPLLQLQVRPLLEVHLSSPCLDTCWTHGCSHPLPWGQDAIQDFFCSLGRIWDTGSLSLLTVRLDPRVQAAGRLPFSGRALGLLFSVFGSRHSLLSNLSRESAGGIVGGDAFHFLIFICSTHSILYLQLNDK